FYVFTLEAAAGKGPWNLHYRVTLPDAIELGLLDRINAERGTKFTPEQFIADCKARAGQDHIFQQTYMCNPVPGGAAIVDWPTIERCRCDTPIERIHLESNQITDRFAPFQPHLAPHRESEITSFIHASFPALFDQGSPIKNQNSKIKNPPFRL